MESWEEFAVVTLEVPAVIAALIGGVIGAWLFMMRTGESAAIVDNA